MLKSEDIEFTYREYSKVPLTEEELTSLLVKLDRPACSLLRKRDKAYKELGLTGTESDAVLVPLIARYPTLLERPIGVVGDRAEVGRPPANLLKLMEV
ncbi:MAG: arsenate reductase (glutaredoxin) [Rickettsiales bacterium]|nr:arsenate reductase (glutaredoxin) [Rickettsiales bacterium]